MKNTERYLVPVTPGLEAKAAERWVRNINTLLKTNLLYGLHLDQGTALKIMVDLAGEIAPFRKALFYLMEDEDRTFNIAATRGFEGPVHPSLLHGNPLVTWTVEKHQPLRVIAPDQPDLWEVARATDCPCVVSLPITVMNEVKGVLQLFSHDENAFPDETVRHLWILALQVGGLLVRFRQESLGKGAEAEPGTGLLSRSSFESEVMRELFRSRRNDRAFSILLVGIDGYEKIASGLSPAEGNRLIREITALFRKAGRKMDLVARHSDPVLALLLPEVDEGHASIFAARVQGMVGGIALPGVDGKAASHATVSIGVASFPFFVTPTDLLAGAEKALERARHDGENRVVQASNLGPNPRSEPVSLGVGELLGTVGQHFDLQGIIGNLVGFYGRVLGAERVSIQTFDPADSSLHFFQGKGFQGFEDDLRREPARLERSISGKTLLSKRPLVVEDIERSIPDRKRRSLRYRGGSFMTIPLFHQGSPVGVINFSNKKEGGAFTREDLDHISRHIPILAEFLAVGRRFEEIQDSFFRKTAEILLGVAESKTSYLEGHGERVARTTSQLAAGMGLSPDEAVRLTDSARYHDLGRIAVDEAILSKVAPLDEAERDQIQQHPEWSSRILESIPGLNLDWGAIRSHHERLDGKGYPLGLLGEEIPLGGRVLAVADAFDALTHPRPYRKAYDPEEALRLLEGGKGTQWDSRVVNTLRAVATTH